MLDALDSAKPTPPYEPVKRIFDVVGGFVLLLLGAPLILVSFLAVRLSSRGPVLFGHVRCGRGGEPFRCLKLRTMVVGAEEWLEQDPELRATHRNNGYKLNRSEDPRVTPVGHFLRFSHIDELPQLINVLRGEMSLVGPRPIVEAELEWYGDRRDEILSVRPGVFGAWTGQGRKRVDYPERAEVELEYVRNQSLLRDVEVLLRNVPVVITGQQEEE